MSDIQINQVLQQMRAMAAMAQNPAAQASSQAAAAETAKADFGKLMADSINKVNSTQEAASAATTAFELGKPGVELSDVMIAVQKASVSFQAMTQVRNNLVSAYKEIMNMQV